MRLGILGASGATGQQLVYQAAETYGDNVIAFVRDPSKMKYTHDKVTVRKVDIYNVDSMADAFRDCDVIISALGATGYSAIVHATLYSRSIQHIISAMRKAGVKRFVAMTSAGTEDDGSLSFMLRWVIKPLLLGRILNDMRTMEQYLITLCSDMEYTVIRPPALTNSAMDGRDLLVEEDISCVSQATYSIPRADTARFMLMCARTPLHVNKMVAIGLPK